MRNGIMVGIIEGKNPKEVGELLVEKIKKFALICIIFKIFFMIKIIVLQII